MTIDVCITDSEYADDAVETEVFTAARLSSVRHQCITEDDVIAAAGDSPALLVQYAPITRRVIESLPSLRIVSRYGTGYDNLDVQAATERGVWVTNVPVYGTDEVAVHTFTLMLAAARGQSYYDAARRAGTWPPPAQITEHPRDLSVGVLGAGRIGRRVIELCSAVFGPVTWHDPYYTGVVDGATRATSLDELLAASNILTVHLPLTEETAHTIGYDEIARLREPRILVNASRGAIVSSGGLERALADGTLWAAGLDMIENEPTDSRGPILSSERVIASPHAAWASVPALVDVRRRAASNVVDVLTGRAPATPVNAPVVSA